MEFLLDPNIAYLLLVGGIFLVVLSFITPGTGIVEISALFVLVLAGWDIYKLPVNYWALALLILGVIPFLLALRATRKTIYLALSILVIVFASSFLFRSEIWWQPAVNPFLAVITSILFAAYMWIGINKVLEAERSKPKHELNSLIGQVGEAKTNVYEEGSVQVAGELWSATSNQPISINARVRVLRRQGFILEVEEIPPTHQDNLPLTVS